MRIIVSDTSCLIDLKRAGLLAFFVQLPYEFIIPDVIFHKELVSFSKTEKNIIKNSMTIGSLEPKKVSKVREILQEVPALSIYDAFAFIVAKQNQDSILLTGDRRLRNLSISREVEVHGVLWVIEELEKHSKASKRIQIKALEQWRNDPLARLPQKTINSMIKKLKGFK